MTPFQQRPNVLNLLLTWLWLCVWQGGLKNEEYQSSDDKRPSAYDEVRPHAQSDENVWRGYQCR
jgi:hypothetical protein